MSKRKTQAKKKKQKQTNEKKKKKKQKQVRGALWLRPLRGVPEEPSARSAAAYVASNMQ